MGEDVAHGDDVAGPLDALGRLAGADGQLQPVGAPLPQQRHVPRRHVFIINASTFITVENNTFDTAANTNQLQCIFIGSGGAGFPVPSDITIRNNTFKLRPNAKDVLLSGTIPRVTQTGNTIINLP